MPYTEGAGGSTSPAIPPVARRRTPDGSSCPARDDAPGSAERRSGRTILPVC